MSTDDLAFARDVAAHPVSLSWDEGCSGVEYEGEHRPFRWCTGAGLLRIHNALPFRRSVSIRMKLYAAQPPAKLKLDGLLSGTIDLVGLVTFAREISLPPGDHVVRFACDGKPAYAPGDSRTLVWHISSFTIDEIRVPGAP